MHTVVLQSLGGSMHNENVYEAVVAPLGMIDVWQIQAIVVLQTAVWVDVWQVEAVVPAR